MLDIDHKFGTLAERTGKQPGQARHTTIGCCVRRYAPPQSRNVRNKKMKKEYLIQKQAEAKRLLGRFLFVVLALAVVLAFVAAPTSPGQRAIIGNICIIVLVTFVLGGIIWIGKRTDVRCPACGKSIQGGIHTPLALTTGKCGHCGKKIIEEEAEPEVAPYR